MSHKKAIAITCFVALMWSLAGFNIKMIEWSPYAIAAGRSLVAVILLAPMVLRKGFQKIDRYVIGGAICYAAFNYCFITSTTLTSSAIAIMMQYTAPIYVALLSWLFLRERVGWADIISVGFVFLGMIFFFLDSNSGGSLKGNIVSIFRNHLCWYFHLSAAAEGRESRTIHVSRQCNFRCGRTAYYVERRYAGHD